MRLSRHQVAFIVTAFLPGLAAIVFIGVLMLSGRPVQRVASPPVIEHVPGPAVTRTRTVAPAASRGTVPPAAARPGGSAVTLAASTPAVPVPVPGPAPSQTTGPAPVPSAPASTLPAVSPSPPLVSVPGVVSVSLPCTSVLFLSVCL